MRSHLADEILCGRFKRGHWRLKSPWRLARSPIGAPWLPISMNTTKRTDGRVHSSTALRRNVCEFPLSPATQRIQQIIDVTFANGTLEVVRVFIDATNHHRLIQVATLIKYVVMTEHTTS